MSTLIDFLEKVLEKRGGFSFNEAKKLLDTSELVIIYPFQVRKYPTRHVWYKDGRLVADTASDNGHPTFIKVCGTGFRGEQAAKLINSYRKKDTKIVNGNPYYWVRWKR
jgi:hypothetical protein